MGIDEFGIKKEILDKIREVLSAYKGVERAVLIGSRAKGDYRRGSDIDIVVWGSGLAFSDYLKLIAELEELNIPFKVDLLKYELIESDAMKRHIKRVGKEIYVRS